MADAVRSGRPASGPVSPFTLRRLERIADAALREAGVLGVLPTPLDALHEVAHVSDVAPMPELPSAVRTPGRKLLGALWFEERTIFVDEAQAAPRRRFTQAHELIHALCPWHGAALREDTEAELFRPAVDALEAEANAGAGMLIFQHADFAAHAQDGSPSLAAALALAGRYGASRHAAIHHYVESHPEPVALLITGRFPRRDGSLPVWRGVESAAFRARHGGAALRFPDGLRPGGALLELAEAARVTSDVPCAALRLPGTGERVRAEAYDNRHAFLVLLAATTRRAAPPARAAAA